MFGKRKLREERDEWKASFLRVADENQELQSKVDALTYRADQQTQLILDLKKAKSQADRSDRKSTHAAAKMEEALEACVYRVEELHADFGLEDNGTAQAAREAIAAANK